MVIAAGDLSPRVCRSVVTSRIDASGVDSFTRDELAYLLLLAESLRKTP